MTDLVLLINNFIYSLVQTHNMIRKTYEKEL